MADPSTDLTQRVRDAVAGSYDLLGPLGTDEAGLPLYLARELGSGSLVGMTARRERPDDDEYTVEVRRTLGESVSVGNSTCPECNSALTALDRFCPNCNTDLSGGMDAEGSPEAAQLLNALALATVGRYEILGRMLSEGHGGTVYFARDIPSKAIVALRMRRAEKSDGVTAEYVVRQTQAFRTPIQPYPSRPTSKFGSILGSAKAAMSGSFSPVAGAHGAAKSGGAATSGASPAISASTKAVAPTGSGPIDAVADSAPGDGAPRKSRVPMIAAAVVILAGVGYFATRGRGGAETAVAPAVLDTNAAVAVAPPPVGAPVDSAAAMPVATTPTPTEGAPSVAGVDSGTVRIGTIPADARVTLNGRAVRGRTLRVPAGTYTIAVAANGFEPFTQRVAVGAGREVRFAPTLVATAATGGGTPTQSGGANTCRAAVRQEQWANALDLCAAEANAGEATAATALARMFSRGLGTARNGTMAMNWYTKAAEGGDLEAQTALAYAMRDGRDTRKDAGGSVRWFKTAAERGDASAQLEYAVALEKGEGTAKEERAARDWYRKSADAGNSMAARRLAKMLERGAGGARSDADAAVAFERAASLGDVESTLTIAKWYRDGKGVAKSPEKALQWFRKAAEQGNAEAAAEVRRLEKGL
ncbi:MAG TPA: PEGA domain-containing protein [Gemmatimonas sp.]|nr:PEGA domain-containing protein [Gemmatimonas sp.]